MSDVAEDLLTAASSLLRSDGAAALSVRRVAEAAGCSTMAIYSRFGGKAGLLDALARDGFDRLADAVDLAQAESGAGPVGEIVAMCSALREAAIADPSRYRLMFGPMVAPGAETRSAARRTLEGLGEALDRASSAGALAIADGSASAEALFALCHGLIGVELGGILEGDGAARLTAAVDVALSGLEVGS